MTDSNTSNINTRTCIYTDFRTGEGYQFRQGGKRPGGETGGQSALGPMCDAEKDWHERSFRASGEINGCQKFPLNEPEINFSFFIFEPPVVYLQRPF